MSKQRHKEKADASPSLTRLVPGLLLAAVVALLVATPILPSEAAPHDGTHATLAMLWCLLLVGWSLAAIGELVPPLRWNWTLVAAGALIGLHTLSAVVMGSQGGMRPALNMLWVWVSYGIAAFLLFQLVRAPSQGRAVMAVMAALGVALSTHASYQYFVSQPALQKAYKVSPDKFLEESGYSKDPSSPDRKHFEDRVFSREPLATFSLTNSLAGYLAPWLIVAAGIALGQWGRGGDRGALAAGIGATLLMAGCLLLTKSRTGILASLLGAVLLLLYARRGGMRIGWKVPALAASILVLVGLGVIFVGGLDKQVLSQAPQSVLYRLQYWRSTAAMIADHPLLGCGPGRFQAFYSRYKLPEASESVADPHNVLLEIGATAGTPAILAFLAMIGLLALEIWRGGGSSQPEAIAPLPTQAHSSVQKSASASVRLFYLAALAGLCLGIALAYLAGHNVLSPHNGGTIGLLLLGLPAAGLFLGMLHRWINEGDLPISVPEIGLIVLGVNLLAAGAAGFPGVAQTAWVLIPVTLGLASSPINSRPPRWTVIAIAGVSVLLALACYLTGYSPVLYSQARLSDAEVPFQSSENVRSDLAAAAAADPWGAEPWERLAELHLELWLQRKVDHPLAAEDRAEFARAAQEYARREVPSYRVSQRQASWYLRLYARSQDPADLEEALAAAREAASRYPASALVHAELAAVWKLSEDDSAAQMEAEEALRLDKLNPHQEFKLQKHHLHDYRWDAAASRVVPVERPETTEQTMLELRKGLRAGP